MTDETKKEADDGKDEYAGFAFSEDDGNDSTISAGDESVEANAGGEGTEGDEEGQESDTLNSSDADKSGDETIAGSAGKAESKPEEKPVAPQQTQERRYSEQDYLSGIEQTDKMLDELAQKYEDGEIDFKGYRTEERKLSDQRSSFRDEVSRMQAERQIRERDWNLAVTDFFKDPLNAVFNVGGALAPNLRERLQAAYADPATAAKSYKEILTESADSVRNQLRSALGIPDPQPASPAVVDELKAKRDARKASAVSTPARGTRAGAGTAIQPDPFAGWAAED
jgi:hypothetical protein